MSNHAFHSFITIEYFVFKEPDVCLSFRFLFFIWCVLNCGLSKIIFQLQWEYYFWNSIISNNCTTFKVFKINYTLSIMKGCPGKGCTRFGPRHFSAAARAALAAGKSILCKRCSNEKRPTREDMASPLSKRRKTGDDDDCCSDSPINGDGTSSASSAASAAAAAAVAGQWTNKRLTSAQHVVHI